jgi:hypothetical protein
MFPQKLELAESIGRKVAYAQKLPQENNHQSQNVSFSDISKGKAQKQLILHKERQVRM